MPIPARRIGTIVKKLSFSMGNVPVQIGVSTSTCFVSKSRVIS